MRYNNMLLSPKYQSKKTWTSLQTTGDLDDFGHVQGRVIHAEESSNGGLMQLIVAINDNCHTTDSVVCSFKNCKGDTLRLPQPGALVRVALIQARSEVTSCSLSQLVFTGPVLIEIEQGREKWLVDTRPIGESEGLLAQQSHINISDWRLDTSGQQGPATLTVTESRAILQTTTAAQVDQNLKNAREQGRGGSFELQDVQQGTVTQSPEVDNTRSRPLESTTASIRNGKLKLGKVWPSQT